MILPILAYGHPLLRVAAADILPGDLRLKKLISDLWDTMPHAGGCGLAAPQVGFPVRVFIVDSRTTFLHLPDAEKTGYFQEGDEGIFETFINPRITFQSKQTSTDEEGCLSIPGLTAPINRSWTIRVTYFNGQLLPESRFFSGATARMIQHEYDHLEGILFTDRISSLKRKLLEAKLKKISRGQITAAYSLKYR